MQEKVLTSILLSFQQGRKYFTKHLVHSVLQLATPRDPDGNIASVQRIVDLLDDASCFQVNIQQ